jgi:peptidoglycan/xylan/chitin deacetylase (PgdA/CDA1 family)
LLTVPLTSLLWFLPPVLTLYALEPIPDRLVVLTFDDSVKSHYSVVRPILKKYGFGATFFITEGFDFATNKEDYLTWDEIRQLHNDGFEIGNHTRDHMAVTAERVGQLGEQLQAIDDRCREQGIPETVTFAYPANRFAEEAFSVLQEKGIRFARRGGSPERDFEKDRGQGVAYEPGLDHPLLVPSAGNAHPCWDLSDFTRAVEQARHGRIAVLQFHGVPDRAHPWVNTPVEKF